jgi:hypothetical protein
VQEHRTKRDQSCEEGRVRTLTCHRFLVVARTTAPAAARATWGRCDVSQQACASVRQSVSTVDQSPQVCSRTHTHTRICKHTSWPRTCSVGRPRLTTSSHTTAEARALRTCIASSTPRGVHHQPPTPLTEGLKKAGSDSGHSGMHVPHTALLYEFQSSFI